MTRRRSDVYRRYLASWAWRFKRWAVFRARGHRCERCGASHRLNVHHRTYERLGHELLEDLAVLCRECHAREHEIATPREQHEPQHVGSLVGDVLDRIRRHERGAA